MKYDTFCAVCLLMQVCACTPHIIHTTHTRHSPPRSVAQDTQHEKYHISSKNSGAKSQWPALLRCLPTLATQDTPHDIYHISSKTNHQPPHTHPHTTHTTHITDNTAHNTHYAHHTHHTTHNTYSMHTLQHTQHTQQVQDTLHHDL